MDKPALLAAFDATEEDLHANRDGQLTASQQQALLLKRVARDLTLLAGLVTVPFLLPVAIIVLLVSPENATCGGIVLVGIVAWFGYLGWSMYEVRQDRQAAQVDVLKGTIKVGQGLAPTQGCMRVQGQRFLVPQKVTLALQMGERYTVYYAPHTRVVVNAERSGEV